jgi:RNA polymerase sigma-70 factor, ECF subfamily
MPAAIDGLPIFHPIRFRRESITTGSIDSEGSMGSAVLEAILPAVNVVVEDALPVKVGNARVVRSCSTKNCRPAKVRGGRIEIKRESEGVLVAGKCEPVPHPTAHAKSANQTEIPPTPGELVLREFDALYAKYQRRVYRQCFRMVRNQDEAEDMTQEVFLLLFRKAHTFRGESNFTTWLHRLTVNTVLMRLRTNRRWRERVSSLDVVLGPAHDASENSTLASTLPAPPTSTVERIGLDTAIGQLSSGYRQIFLLHDEEGYRHDEIGRLLGISEGTSKSQLHKARSRLRKLIKSGSTRSESVSPPAMDEGYAA